MSRIQGGAAVFIGPSSLLALVPNVERRSWGALLVCMTTAVAFLMGCRTYEAKPLDPEVEWAALENMIDRIEGVEREAAAPVGSPTWFPWTTSVDLRDGVDLAEASAIAWACNPTLAQSRQQLQLAQAHEVQQGLWSNPEFFVGPRFATDSSDVIGPASISWELPLWGVPGARREAAAASARREAWLVKQLELEVFVQVRLSFIELTKLEEQRAAIETLDQVVGLLDSWMTRLQAAGEVDATTAWLASWERAQAEMLAQENQMNALVARARLLELLGLLPDADMSWVLAGSRDLPALPQSSLETRRRLPRVRAAEEAYEASEAELRLQVALQYPTVRLGPEYEDDDGDVSIGFGVGVELPLFDRNQGAIEAAEHRRDADRESFRALLLQVSHEEARARLRLATAQELLNSLRRGPAREADQALQTLQSRLELGSSTLLEVLTAIRALTEVRLREIQLRADRVQAVLEAAVAGGVALAALSDSPLESARDTEVRD